jgi:hypothetical protein
MKIGELMIDEWDGTYKLISEIGSLKILLLNLIDVSGSREAGRRNLIAIDENANIIWLAEPPLMGRKYGPFSGFKSSENKLTGWYGGSVLVEIDPSNGKLISEAFVK